MIKPSVEMSRLLRLAQLAGREIMDIYETEFDAREKDDLTPVTDADLRAEEVILHGLARDFPDDPVLSEESAASACLLPTTSRFFLVDPLDGTKEFIARHGDFTVNIAMIDRGTPIMGVVYAPALARMFWGEMGRAAAQARLHPDEHLASVDWQSLAARPPMGRPLRAVASRSHRDAETDRWLHDARIRKVTAMGSSLKFCVVAAGEADVYPRFSRTMEWDTAAGHAVLLAAGGTVSTPAGLPLTYGKRDRGYDNPPFIAAA
jgi:3'(2'), 5'-bisphosphate nucleotidase